jgi:hypothetical protein
MITLYKREIFVQVLEISHKYTKILKLMKRIRIFVFITCLFIMILCMILHDEVRRTQFDPTNQPQFDPFEYFATF